MRSASSARLCFRKVFRMARRTRRTCARSNRCPSQCSQKLIAFLASAGSRQSAVRLTAPSARRAYTGLAGLSQSDANRGTGPGRSSRAYCKSKRVLHDRSPGVSQAIKKPRWSRRHRAVSPRRGDPRRSRCCSARTPRGSCGRSAAWRRARARQPAPGSVLRCDGSRGESAPGSRPRPAPSAMLC
jgi:hypothetical protein